MWWGRIKSSNEDECFLVSLPVFSMRQSLSHSVTDGPIYWWEKADLPAAFRQDGLKYILYAISNIFYPVCRGDIHVMYVYHWAYIYGDLIYQMLGIVQRNVGNARIVKYASHAGWLQRKSVCCWDDGGDHLNKKWTRNLSLTLLTLQSLNWNHDSSHWVDANNFNIFIAPAWAPGTYTHWRLDASRFILNH